MDSKLITRFFDSYLIEDCIHSQIMAIVIIVSMVVDPGDEYLLMALCSHLHPYPLLLRH